MAIEDIYGEIGGMGRFQILTVFMLSSSLFTIGWSMLQMTFAGAIPDFKCQQFFFDANNSDFIFNNSSGVTLANWTTNTCSLKGLTCLDFVYETSSRTVITEWNLICDKEWTKRVIISIQMVGVLIGALLCGQLGDRFGRKKVLYSFNLAHVILNFIAAFSSSWIMFASLRFFLGVCIGAIILIILPYELEFLPLRWRPLIGIVPAWSVGVAIFASAALLLDNWSYLHIACGATSIPCLFGFFFVPESVRWLAVHGKLDDAENIIEFIAKINKKPVPPGVFGILKNVQEQQLNILEETRKFTYIDLFKEWTTARLSFILFYIWFSMSVVYYGISFGVASLTGNLYLNIFLLGIMEIPVQTTTFCFNNKIGRRKTTFMFFLLSVIPIIASLLFHLFSPSHIKGIAINVCCQFAKMMIGSAWSAMQVWGTESYPTVVRNLGCGFQSFGARIGGIIAPLLINLDRRVTESYSAMSALLIITCILTFAIPETNNKQLVDTTRRKQQQQVTSDEGSIAFTKTIDEDEDVC